MFFTPTPTCPQSICNMFSISPASGIVSPSDKPLPVQIGIIPKRELVIVNEPILQCKVIEPRRPPRVSEVRSEVRRTTHTLAGTIPSLPNTPSINSQTVASVVSVPSIGDVLANIPIRVLCQSSYSKFVVCQFLLLFDLFHVLKSSSSSLSSSLSGLLLSEYSCFLNTMRVGTSVCDTRG